MKKTYFAPELENIKMLSNTMFQSASPESRTLNDSEGTSEQNLSKGFSGGLWDEEVEE